MGPNFRAAEQPSQTQFHIFPVSLGDWVRHRGLHTGSHSPSCLIFILSSMPSYHPSGVDKYLSTDMVLMWQTLC